MSLEEYFAWTRPRKKGAKEQEQAAKSEIEQLPVGTEHPKPSEVTAPTSVFNGESNGETPQEVEGIDPPIEGGWWVGREPPVEGAEPIKDKKQKGFWTKPGWERPVHEKSLRGLLSSRRSGIMELRVQEPEEAGYHEHRVMNNALTLAVFSVLARDIGMSRARIQKEAKIRTKVTFYNVIRRMMSFGWVERDYDEGVNAYYYRLSEKGAGLKAKLLRGCE